MKKTLFWGIILAVFIIGGTGIIATQNSQHASQVKQSQSSKSSSSKESSSSSSMSSSSSNAASSSHKSEDHSSDSSSADTGNAGKTGAGKKEDQTVNGKKVDQDTIENIKSRLNQLGYNANSWSPQDIINLYRYASNQGHTDPEQISKHDIESYLKN